jgi:hypothetical protein
LSQAFRLSAHEIASQRVVYKPLKKNLVIARLDRAIQ